jgi:hypothetical protein
LIHARAAANLIRGLAGLGYREHRSLLVQVG